jgi:hypothetical protein
LTRSEILALRIRLWLKTWAGRVKLISSYSKAMSRILVVKLKNSADRLKRKSKSSTSSRLESFSWGSQFWTRRMKLMSAIRTLP